MPNDRTPQRPDFNRDAREDGSDQGLVTPGALTDIGGTPDKTVTPGAITDLANPDGVLPPGSDIVGGDMDRNAL